MTAEFTPYFLASGSDSLFCAYYPAIDMGDPQLVEAVIYLPAFAEEMNKSRRMLSLQAQALARAGIASLIVDLYGTGDSTGDFSEARWELWKRDIENVVQWLQQRGHMRISFLTVRLGGLLALDFVASRNHDFEKMIWWQPVVVGETHLMQFLRLRVAAAMFSKGGEEKESTKSLRARLVDGEIIEVGGYDIHPQLADAIGQQRAQNHEKLRLKQLNMMELVASAEKKSSPPVIKLADQWRQAGLEASSETVTGDHFWSTQEISICPELVERTTLKWTSIDQSLPRANKGS